jgi:hypothetical protein
MKKLKQKDSKNHKTKRIITKYGDKYGLYTVISKKPFRRNKAWHVKVRCECGKIRIVPTGNIKRINSCKSCFAKNNLHKYKSGDIINNFTVIGYTKELINNRRKILIRCVCGYEYVTKASELGKTKVCKNCSRRKRGIDHVSYKGTKNITGTYFAQVKLGAKSKNRKFSLTIEDMDLLLEKQNHKCYLTGREISVHNKTASLDRIDSSKGYTIDNIGWVHKDLQRMKSDFDLEYFIRTCHEISKEWKDKI